MEKAVIEPVLIEFGEELRYQLLTVALQHVHIQFIPTVIPTGWIIVGCTVRGIVGDVEQRELALAGEQAGSPAAIVNDIEYARNVVDIRMIVVQRHTGGRVGIARPIVRDRKGLTKGWQAGTTGQHRGMVGQRIRETEIGARVRR